MKVKNLLFCTLFFCCAIGIQTLNAQLVEESSITANEANFKMISPNSYLMEIAGPNNYYFKQEIAYTKNISLSNVDMKGKKFSDGTYKMQVTPIVTLSETIRTELAALRKENDQEKIAAYRLAHALPASVNVYNISFSIRNGEFVSPDQKEVKEVNLPNTAITWKSSSLWQQDHPVLYASINNVDMDFGKPVWASNALPLVRDNTPMIEDDQQFLDDVIIVGSLCVGQDCNNGESFGFDTQRLKENNLRIHFDDTSTSASFPKNDWRIRINDSANGGASYFAVEDATGGKTPFLIEAGAPTNSLYVEDGGRIGIGTSTPVTQIHTKDGNTPTLRLEQDGTSGFTPQTWDVASNEANFFIRDATNGSTLPFRIFPGAPSNSITIEGTTGDVGLGTTSPEAGLHVNRASGTDPLFLVSGNGTVLPIFESSDNGAIQVRLRSDGANRRVLAVNSADVPQSQIIFGDSEVQLAGPNTTGANLFATFTSAGLVTSGAGACNPGPCDGTFQPDFEVPTIKEHSAFMWENSYLWGVGPTLEGAPINLTVKTTGILHELEVAHIYIEQLHNRMIDMESRLEANNKLQQTINQQAEEIADLKAQQTKMEALETQLAELSQLVTTLNKTHNSSDSADKAIGEKE